MSLPYDPIAVKQVESQAHMEMGFPALSSDKRIYFQETIGQYLYQCWLHDRQDTRILTYCQPICWAVLTQRLALLMSNDIDIEDTYQSLLVISMDLLNRLYRPDRGRIFTFLSLTLRFKLVDIIDKRIKEADTCQLEPEQIGGIETRQAWIELESLKSYLSEDLDTRMARLLAKLLRETPEIVAERWRLLPALAMGLGITQTEAKYRLAALVKRYRFCAGWK